MTQQEPDFTTLSAYVDGELDPATSARVARLIATDPATARLVARLSELKQAVAQSAPEVVVFRAPPPPPPIWRCLVPAAAMVFLAMAVAGTVWWSGSTVPQLAQTASPPLTDQVARLHDLAAQDEAAPLPATAAMEYFTPELRAAGLRLVSVRTGLEIEGRRAHQVSYVGQRGCRLSLFEFPGIAADDSFSVTTNKDLRSAAWVAGGIHYLMVARNMDETRFAVIAAALRSMTIHRTQPSGPMIASLEQARQPCLS